MISICANGERLRDAKLIKSGVHMHNHSEDRKLGRRELLGAGAIAGLAIGLGRNSSVYAMTDVPSLYDKMFREQLKADPERATRLGLDVGPLAELRAKLNDYSTANRHKVVNAARKHLTELSGLPQDWASTMDCRVIKEMLSNVIQRGQFAFGSVSGYTTPYAISTLTGPYQSIPDFLDRDQPLANDRDAEAYLSRLKALAVALDQNTAAYMDDLTAGAGLPAFLLQITLMQLRMLGSPSPNQSIFVRSVTRRSEGANWGPTFARRSEMVVRDFVYPAIHRQISALARTQDTATEEAGVWRLPDGEAYYELALMSETTTKLTPAEIHTIGRDEVARLSEELDQHLRSLEISQGTVIERLDSMTGNLANYYENTDKGRSALLSDIRTQIDETYKRIPQLFRSAPPNSIDVRRVPALLEASYPGGSYAPAPIDGSRPATFSMNLANMRDRPSYGYPTLTFHETVPGHHLQIGLAQELSMLPAIRRYAEFSAYVEGWAVYAEGLGMGMGIPNLGKFANVGYLQSMLFRAARLVVDTGLHAKRWSREQAAGELAAICGMTNARASREIDRYCVFPGQACSYMIGHRTWMSLREVTRRRDGTKFDLRDFHELLRNGPMPLHLLEEVAGAVSIRD